MRGILAGESVTHESPHYSFHGARHEPGPVQSRVPILMGSSGEKKGLRLVARHADYWQAWIGLKGMAELERLSAVLARHCEDVGRDPATIHRWPGIKLVIRDTRAAARHAWDALGRRHGWSAETLAYLEPMTWLGTPRDVAGGLRRLVDLGCDGVIFSAMHPYDTETFERLIGEAGPIAGLA
jgi:alkanesulfonate monooxygenase SsuD/methylene tetrahydromethanopterin reductase-like flavin-dependent oxidoreductase (luciferase family)